MYVVSNAPSDFGIVNGTSCDQTVSEFVYNDLFRHNVCYGSKDMLFSKLHLCWHECVHAKLFERSFEVQLAIKRISCSKLIAIIR